MDNFIIVFLHSIINKKNNRKLDLKAKILPRFSEIGDLRYEKFYHEFDILYLGLDSGVHFGSYT